MNLSIFIAVIFSAFLHASWNVAGKKVASNIAIPALGFLISGLLLSPYLLNIVATPLNWGAILFWTFISGLIHVIYIALLFNAYKQWDVAIIYPIVRSTGVMICAVASLYFFKETLSILGIIGIGCIILGILIKGIYKQFFDKNAPGFNVAVPVAAGIGCLVGSYLIVDRIAINLIDPLSYIILLNLMTGLLFLPYLFIYKRHFITDAIKKNKRYMAIIGGCNMCSYLTILWVFTQTKFGYVTSLREISIIFSVFLGYIFLKEKITKIQGIAILFLLLGAFIIKLST